MNRREFLKLAGATAALLAMPTVAELQQRQQVGTISGIPVFTDSDIEGWTFILPPYKAYWPMTITCGEDSFTL